LYLLRKKAPLLGFTFCGLRGGAVLLCGYAIAFQSMRPGGAQHKLIANILYDYLFQSLHPTRGATVKVNGNTSSKRKTRQIVLAPYGFPLYIAPFEKSSKKTESRFPTHLSSISHVFSFFEGDRDDRRSVSLCFLYRCVRKPRPSGLPFVVLGRGGKLHLYNINFNPCTPEGATM